MAPTRAWRWGRPRAKGMAKALVSAFGLTFALYLLVHVSLVRIEEEKNKSLTSFKKHTLLYAAVEDDAPAAATADGESPRSCRAAL